MDRGASSSRRHAERLAEKPSATPSAVKSASFLSKWSSSLTSAKPSGKSPDAAPEKKPGEPKPKSSAATPEKAGAKTPKSRETTAKKTAVPIGPDTKPKVAAEPEASKKGADQAGSKKDDAPSKPADKKLAPLFDTKGKRIDLDVKPASAQEPTPSRILGITSAARFFQGRSSSTAAVKPEATPATGSPKRAPILTPAEAKSRQVAVEKKDEGREASKSSAPTQGDEKNGDEKKKDGPAEAPKSAEQPRSEETVAAPKTETSTVVPPGSYFAATSTPAPVPAKEPATSGARPATPARPAYGQVARVHSGRKQIDLRINNGGKTRVGDSVRIYHDYALAGGQFVGEFEVTAVDGDFVVATAVEDGKNLRASVGDKAVFGQ